MPRGYSADNHDLDFWKEAFSAADEESLRSLFPLDIRKTSYSGLFKVEPRPRIAFFGAVQLPAHAPLRYPGGGMRASSGALPVRGPEPPA